jgi:hypothetical protein
VEQARYCSDADSCAIITRLTLGPHALLRPVGGEPFWTPTAPTRDQPFDAQLITLTKPGARVIAEKASRGDDPPVDYSLGGAHREPGDNQQWDVERTSVVTVR